MVIALTPTQINERISTIVSLNIDERIIITGEISNFKLSGVNLFCTLKDSASSISLTMWGYAKNLDEKNYISNGDKVTVTGKISFYSKTGSYCVSAYRIEKTGVGDLHTEYEKLKLKFKEMGFFDRKKELPSKIKNLGIITAHGGAALQDVLYVLEKNKFRGNVFVKNCNVQGSNCPRSVIESIRYFNSNIYPDIILICRGGGSFEDLMGYSDEKLLYAIFESEIPTISAIGHEVDFMLSDFVADYRAPTPSIAGEVITRINNKIVHELEDNISFLENIVYKDIVRDLDRFTLLLENFVSKNDIEKNAQIMETDIGEKMAEIEKFIEIELTEKIDVLNKYKIENSKYDDDFIMELGYAKIYKIKSSSETDSRRVRPKKISTDDELEIVMRDRRNIEKNITIKAFVTSIDTED